MNLNNSPRAIHEYELQPKRLFKFQFMNYALIMMSLDLGSDMGKLETPLHTIFTTSAPSDGFINGHTTHLNTQNARDTATMPPAAGHFLA